MQATEIRLVKLVFHESRGWRLRGKPLQGLGVEPVFNFKQPGIIDGREWIMRTIRLANDVALALLAAVRRSNVPSQCRTGSPLGCFAHVKARV